MKDHAEEMETAEMETEDGYFTLQDETIFHKLPEKEQYAPEN